MARTASVIEPYGRVEQISSGLCAGEPVTRQPEVRWSVVTQRDRPLELAWRPGPGRERQVDPLEILGPRLRVHVALSGRDPGVPKKLLNEASVCVS